MIDMNQVRAKLDALNNKNKSKGAPINKEQNERKTLATWKPVKTPENKGEFLIRIVPYTLNPTWPFVELLYYYKNFGYSKLSPASYGGYDPIIEFADDLIKNSTTKQEKYQGYKLKPESRHHALVIVRGEEEKGPRWWNFGIKIFNTLCTTIDDPEYGDITDPINGRDIKLILKTKEEAGNDYGSTEISVRPSVRPLSEDPELVKKWLSEQPIIEEIFPATSEEDLRQALDKYMETLLKSKETSKQMDSTEENKSNNGVTPQSNQVSDKAPNPAIESATNKVKSLLDE